MHAAGTAGLASAVSDAGGAQQGIDLTDPRRARPAEPLGQSDEFGNELVASSKRPRASVEAYSAIALSRDNLVAQPRMS
jgi:hypothetical protein